jgi:hypothetical protein
MSLFSTWQPINVIFTGTEASMIFIKMQLQKRKPLFPVIPNWKISL